MITILQVWAGRAELQYSAKIQTQKWPAFFRNLQSLVDCSMERSIKYNFFIDLERIQLKPSSGYSLNIYVSRAIFLILMVHHFLRTSP